MKYVSEAKFLSLAETSQLQPGEFYRIGNEYRYTTYFAVDNSNYNVISNEKGIYHSFLTQSGTDAPTANVVSNSIGESTWTYEDVGIFLISTNGKYTENKTSPISAIGFDILGNNL